MRFFLFHILLASSFVCFSQQTLLKGYVLDATSKKPLMCTEVQLLIEIIEGDTATLDFGDNKQLKTIKTVYTDSNGYYKITGIKPGNYRLSVSYFMEGYNARWNMTEISISDSSALQKDFYLQVECPYDKTKSFTHCPKCKKKDKVQRIVFGLPAYDLNGNLPPEFESAYWGGCVIDQWCNPTKHCNRCNLDF